MAVLVNAAAADSQPPAEWPDRGEPGAAWFFHCHPAAGACRVEWRGLSRDGDPQLDAPDLGLGFVLGRPMWPYAPDRVSVSRRRSGPLFVASCRAFTLAVGRGLGPALLAIAGLDVPEKVRRACWGRLARAAADTMDAAAAAAAVDRWMASPEFADDVGHFSARP